ncbi:MAG: hemerythrin domain-containing protein [Bdellovibrio sp.]|nr:hemerythrin domain-containing protein [Bdellovibrio sp.]
MNPTKILMTEHRVIEQVLNCAEEMARRAKIDGCLNKAMAEKTIDFIVNFSDRCHHSKEETHLFRMMEERGFSPFQGPTAVMRQEHEYGRNCVKQMTDSLSGGAAGDKSALAKFIENAHNFIEMLRPHIQKEDNILYPMANSIFSDDDQSELMAAFHQVEESEMLKGTHEKYLAIAEELANFYGIEKADLTKIQDCGSEMGGCGGCGGF